MLWLTDGALTIESFSPLLVAL